MLFRRLVIISLLAGLVGGFVLSLSQQWQVLPIIFAAEEYESSKAAEVSSESASESHGDHDHGGDWSPEDGLERTLFTVLSNVLTAIGFSLVLVTLIAISSTYFNKEISTLSGLFWGLGGFIAVFASPSFGISPELPGVSGAALEFRQEWWISTVLLTSAGLFLAHIWKSYWRWPISCILLVAPHIYGAPHPENLYAGFPADVAEKLAMLSDQFLVATASSNLIFWVSLGIFSGWALKRFPLPRTV